MGICAECQKFCLCATCVRNNFIYVNTPTPCLSCMCDFCEDFDMATNVFCNQHLTIEEINARIKEKKGGR